MPLRLNGEGELMSPAVSDGAMNGKREKQVPLQRGKSDDWSCLVDQTNNKLTKIFSVVLLPQPW